MSRRWPWFEFRYVFIWWPVCWQGWVVVFGLWALIGCAVFLTRYIPNNSPYALAEGVVILAYGLFFAGTKTDFTGSK